MYVLQCDVETATGVYSCLSVDMMFKRQVSSVQLSSVCSSMQLREVGSGLGNGIQLEISQRRSQNCSICMQIIEGEQCNSMLGHIQSRLLIHLCYRIWMVQSNA